jgi:hypothetical protein
MAHFTYKDNSKGKWVKNKWVAPIVFECDADGLLEADEAYKKAIGQSPAKNPSIACLVLGNG